MVANNMPAESPAATRTAATAASPFQIASPVLIAGAAGLALFAASVTSTSEQIWLGSIALTVFCCGLLLLIPGMTGYQGLGLATWRSGPWSLAWGAIAFGLTTVSWLGQQDAPASAIYPASIMRALWMIAAAMAMLTAGYCAGPYRLAAAQAQRAADSIAARFTGDIRSPAVPWVLFGAGLIGQLGDLAVTGRFGYIGGVSGLVTAAPVPEQYLAIVGECVPLAVLAAAINAARADSNRARVPLYVLFAATICIGAVNGNKSNFVIAMLAFLIPGTVARRRLPVGVMVAATAFFLLVVIPFNQAYRATVRGSVVLSAGQAAATAPQIARQVLDSDLSLTTLGQSVSYLGQRLRTIDTPAIVMQRSPGEIPYGNPAQLLVEPVITLVPRILWPGKPILLSGYQIGQEYYQLPPTILTASNVTPEADLYRHGGWPPLLIGMFFMGCWLRILDELTDLRRSMHGAFLIVLFFPVLVESGGDYSSLFAGIPGAVLLWLAVVSYSFARRRPSARAAAS